MSNIFLPSDDELIYIQVQDVIDSTSKPAIAALTSDEIKQLIYKAELTVDEYTWPSVEPFDEDQPFNFPTVDENDASYLPDDITIATLYTLEYIYVLWDTIIASSWWDVLKEQIWDHTVQYSEWVSSSGLKIPDEAKAILDKYKQSFNKITL